MKGVAMGMFMAAMKADYESKIFQVTYLDRFGVMPEQEEINVYRDAVMVIFNFAGSGKTMLGREKLRNKVYQYADIVDDDPVAIAAFCGALISTVLNKKQKVTFGYKWVVEELCERIEYYNPDASASVLFNHYT